MLINYGSDILLSQLKLLHYRSYHAKMPPKTSGLIQKRDFWLSYWGRMHQSGEALANQFGISAAAVRREAKRLVKDWTLLVVAVVDLRK